MIVADPGFWQRLAKAVQLRGPAPEMDLELLGAVVTLDGGKLLENISEGVLLGPESMLFSGGDHGAAAAVAGQNSRVDLLLGWGGDTTRRRPYRIDLLHLRVNSDQHAWVTFSKRTGAGQGLFGTEYRNLITDGPYGIGNVARWDINTGTAGLEDPNAYKTRLAAAGVLDLTAPAGRALFGGILTQPGDDWLRVRVLGVAANTALDATVTFIARLTPYP